ncbi:LOW QUALITY PROTEIN: UDP-glucose iridoid glucosyltransferase-like [Prosopis cineraria]|uniref:LOW QUALITY PROTEIN: UDP-glucose iridoid glucosyltransferase-like n=1 Tax=Prosopis cineraria TaxID=364024 RepID=UPI00240F1A3D|nr:LOW QUALITY PROTEIN: UDP-glucose iridoid glucosyltransferase-like [Prosopis cineraria]
MEKQRLENRQRLVVVPAPFQGHLTPMLQIASILHSNGFSIIVAHTLFNSPNPSAHPHFLFIPFSDGLSHEDSIISSYNLTTIASALYTNCAAPFKELLLQLTEEAQNIACIIYDGSMYFVGYVAQQLNPPTILLRTTSAPNVLAYHSLHRLLMEGCLPLQGESLVPELEPLRHKDLPTFISTNVDTLLNQMNRLQLGIKSSLGVIFNTVDCLEGQRVDELRQIYHVPMFTMGPFHSMAPESCSSILEQDHSCIAWLNEQALRSVVYVSLGSIITWEEKELTEMAYGLANSNQKFLWVVLARAINVTEWVQSLPEDVKKAIEERGWMVRWAPQKEVLAHKSVGGFWSHCGWNSMLESVYEGKPMICQPCFGDQRVNSRLACHAWKVGVEWSSHVSERGEVEKVVRTLMLESQGMEMWQNAQRMKHKLRQAVTQGGSSYNAAIHFLDHLLSIP